MTGGWASRYRVALRHPDFRLLIAGSVVNQVGSWAYAVALAVYVYSATQSVAWLGAASLARFLPPLLLSPYAGVVAERFERTKVIVVASLVCAALMIALAVTATVDGPVALALVLAALSASAVSVLASVTSTLIPDLVGESNLAAASSLKSTVENAAVIVGPAVGAGLLLLGDSSIVFLLNAATFLFAAEIVLRIRTRSRPIDVADPAGPVHQLLGGLRQLARSSATAVLIGDSVLAGALYGADTVLLVVVSQRQLGTGAKGYGYLLAGLGVGGLIATGLVNRLAASPRLGAIITVGTAAYCLPTAAVIWVHVPAVAFVLQVVRGGGAVAVGTLALTVLQRSSSADVRSRVEGDSWPLILAGSSVGALITALLLSAFGLHAVLLILGVGVTVAAVTAYPLLRRLDQAAMARVRRLEPRVELLHALGLFAGAPRPVLERLAGTAKEFAVAAGTTLVRAGEPAASLYVLEVGEVGEAGPSARAEAPSGRNLSSPAYFGEVGLIERGRRTVTLRALERSKLLRIDGDDFLDALTSTPAPAWLVEGPPARRNRAHPSYRPASASPLARPARSGA